MSMMYGDMGISEELDEERFEVDEGDKAWYVIQTLSGQEKKVKDMLERLKEERFKDIIFDVKFPMMEGYELKEGRKKRIRKKFSLVFKENFSATAKKELPPFKPQEKVTQINKKIKVVGGYENNLSFTF